MGRTLSLRILRPIYNNEEHHLVTVCCINFLHFLENSVQQPSITSPVTVRGIPLSIVEEESAEISRRIAQGLHEKRSVVTEHIDIPSISTVPSDLSQISGTIIVQAANSGK